MPPGRTFFIWHTRRFSPVSHLVCDALFLELYLVLFSQLLDKQQILCYWNNVHTILPYISNHCSYCYMSSEITWIGLSRICSVGHEQKISVWIKSIKNTLSCSNNYFPTFFRDTNIAGGKTVTLEDTISHFFFVGKFYQIIFIFRMHKSHTALPLEVSLSI